MNSKADDKKSEVSEENPASDVEFEPEEGLDGIDALRAKLKKVKAELEACKKERMEYLDGWQRCKADAVNARREALVAAERTANRSRDALIEEIIPALDSFDAAIASDAWKTMDANWRMGMENVRTQLLAALERYDVRPFGAIGDTFDPTAHEAVQETDEAGEPGTIARVLRRGYRSKERVIRPAHVAIAVHRA